MGCNILGYLGYQNSFQRVFDKIYFSCELRLKRKFQRLRELQNWESPLIVTSFAIDKMFEIDTFFENTTEICIFSKNRTITFNCFTLPSYLRMFVGLCLVKILQKYCVSYHIIYYIASTIFHFLKGLCIIVSRR